MRIRVLERDHHQCQLKLPGCTITATQMDHRVPLAAALMVGLTEDQLDCEANTQAVCVQCHKKRTAQQIHYFAGHNVECPWTQADVERLRSETRDRDTTTPRRVDLFPSDRDSVNRGGVNQGQGGNTTDDLLDEWHAGR